MRSILGVIAVVVLLVVAGMATVAYGQGYAVPTVVESYYPPQPVYTCPAPTVTYSYPGAVVVPSRRVVYSPVVAAPVVVNSPVVVSTVAVPTTVVVAKPIVIGPTGKIYIPGRPIRNTVRVVVP